MRNSPESTIVDPNVTAVQAMLSEALGRMPSAHAGMGDLPVRPLDSCRLHDVVNDTRSRGFCGPTAVAAITGEPISLVRDAFRLARYGAGWVNRDRSPPIMGTWPHEVRKVLRLLGFAGGWEKVTGQPTLAAFLDSRAGAARTNPCVVRVTGHFVAVAGWEFCDTFSKGRVVGAEEAPGRRKRVKDVFVVTGRVSPAANIPRKQAASPARLANETRARA